MRNTNRRLHVSVRLSTLDVLSSCQLDVELKLSKSKNSVIFAKLFRTHQHCFQVAVLYLLLVEVNLACGFGQEVTVQTLGIQDTTNMTKSIGNVM